MKVKYAEDCIVNIAPTECGASCIMTALAMMGEDTSLFLLDYWNLNYTSEVLLSSKSIRSIRLKDLYGVQIQFSAGDLRDLTRWLEQDEWLIVRCKASKLSFFPENSLLLEENQVFAHYILLYGFREDEQRYSIIDPVAHYVGGLEGEQLRYACDEEGSIIVYRMKKSVIGFKSPAKEELFVHAANENSRKFKHSAGNGGVPASRQFASDLRCSLDWREKRRDRWLDSNMITVTSIIKLRLAVWNAFCRLDILDQIQIKHGQAQLDLIVKQWTAFNFLLIKYKRKSERNLADLISGKLEEIESNERKFLEWMEEAANELSAI